MFLRTIFLIGLISLPARAADVALVDREIGQAILFENRGLCYAVMPKHISADKDRIALAVPAPAALGGGEIFWRAGEADLALAFVEGDVSARCTVRFNGLSRDLSGLLQRAEAGLIKSVHYDGAFFDRIGAALVDVDDTFVTVRITDGGVDADVLQGLSGAMLSVEGVIAGIAVDAASREEARFLRMDRIVEMIAPHIGAAAHPADGKIEAAESGQGFRVTGASGAGAAALEPSSLTAPWIADWTGAPVVFEITLSNDALVPLNKVVLRSESSDETTPARKIGLDVDRGLQGAAYWTPIATPDMSPNGLFEVTTGGTAARRIRISITDVWHPDRPLRLDALEVE